MEILDKLIAEWKESKSPEYTDVDGEFLDSPSDQQMAEKCPHECQLVIYETSKEGNPWREMLEHPDYYRQTRICRKHSFARIYVTTGLRAVHANYALKTAR